MCVCFPTSCCPLRVSLNCCCSKDTVNSSALNTSTWTTQSASTKQPRYLTHTHTRTHSHTQFKTSDLIHHMTKSPSRLNISLRSRRVSLFNIHLRVPVRPTARPSWAPSASVTSCSTCRRCWRGRSSGTCSWGPRGPDRGAPPSPRWLRAGGSGLWRSWRRPWPSGCAPSTSPPGCEEEEEEESAGALCLNWAAAGGGGAVLQVSTLLLLLFFLQWRVFLSFFCIVTSLIQSDTAVSKELQRKKRHMDATSGDTRAVWRYCPLVDNVAGDWVKWGGLAGIWALTDDADWKETEASFSILDKQVYRFF